MNTAMIENTGDLLLLLSTESFTFFASWQQQRSVKLNRQLKIAIKLASKWLSFISTANFDSVCPINYEHICMIAVLIALVLM